MSILQIVILAIIQGICELLPVSSSAHVLGAAKIMGLDPSKPEMTFLLVMLHTGTMFAVILYFWKSWKREYFSSSAAFAVTVKNVMIATVATGFIGFGLKKVIEKVFLHGGPHAEVEQLFGNFWLIGAALAAVGVLIILAGKGRSDDSVSGSPVDHDLSLSQSASIGVVQGLCLPFRGFSRSGATISTGLLLGVPRIASERFSFALAVVLTPPVILMEAMRLMKHHAAEAGSTVAAAPTLSLSAMAVPGAIGMVCSFLAGLVALKWLSGWLEGGRWQWFGGYCLAASLVAFWLAKFC